MLLEVRTVGRKTPGDGRLEITPATGRRLQMEGAVITTMVGERTGIAAVEVMPCHCGRGPEGAHEHWFVTSELYRELQAGETCALELETGGRLIVARAHPLG